MAQTIVYATGKTERRHRQFEGAHSMKVVHNLVVDLHTSHHGPEVQAGAQGANSHRWESHLHYVPTGQTDKLQPFDRWIFGAVKQKIRGKWAQFVHEDPDAVAEKGMVAKWLV